MPRQSNPKLKAPRMFARSARTQSSDEFLSQLEDLMKKNRGYSDTFAEDTGAEGGYIVPGGIPVRQGQFVPETAGQTRYSGIARPEYPEFPEFDPYSFDLGNTGLETADTRSAQGFFQNLARTLYAPSPQRMSSEELEQRRLQTGEEYPIQSLANGNILWSDGTVRPSSSMQEFNKAPTPIATMQDGNVLWSDGWVRPPMPDYVTQALTGTSALSRGLFGQEQTITQPYGAYNPIEPTPGNINLGTDFRTRDLQSRQIVNYFDTPLEVVESYNQAQAGSGYVGNMENRGYGNSLLLRLPNGTMIRVSHLDENPYKAGDVINPGEFIGVPGMTGNVTGEHADVEVYSADGQIISPEQFFSQVRESAPQQEPLYRMEGNKVVGPSSQERQESGILQKLREARDSGTNFVEQFSKPEQTQSMMRPLDPMSPQRMALGEGIADLGEKAGLPEMYASEVASGQLTPGQGLSYNIENANLTPRIDTGISEALRGDWQGAKTNFMDTASRVGKRVSQLPQQIGNQIVPPAYADDGSQKPFMETLGDNIRGASQSIGQYVGEKAKEGLDTVKGLFSRNQEPDQNVDFKAGSGIEKLKAGDSKSGGAGVNLFSRRDPSDLAGQRVVGTSAGANVLPGGTLIDRAMAQKSMDTSDPFFKTPLFEKLKGFTTFEGGQPGRDQALSMDTFNENFYSDPGRVSQVFQSTYMADPAMKKATEQVKESYRQAYSGSEWDQADVQRILNSLPAVLNYSPNLPEPKKSAPKQQPSLQDYLRMGKTAEQWFAETGQQSVADRAGGAQKAVEQMRSQQASNPYNQSGYQMSVGPQQGVTNAINAAAAGQKYTSPSGNYIPPYSPAGANMTDASTGLPVVGKPASSPARQDSVFDRAKNFTSGIFKRFFN